MNTNLVVDQPAPNFTAQDHFGRTHSLEKLKGKWLLLYFYPKDNTPGCTTEACGLRDYYQELSEENVVILGVSKDSLKSHQNFAQKHDLPFPLLVDDQQKIISAYGADGVFFPKRVSFLIDPQGKIAKIYKNVKPDLHAVEVLGDVKKLKEENS
jgi:thioredoxin-dependent peroxiredoxin